MKKFELNVVNFDNEDVIATSCNLDYYVKVNHNFVGGGRPTVTEYIFNDGEYVEGESWEYHRTTGWDEGTPDELQGNTPNGTYHIVGGEAVTFVENGCEADHAE